MTLSPDIPQPSSRDVVDPVAKSDLALSVIIPTHNPDPRRLRATLTALRDQSLDQGAWETLIVDNASALPVDLLTLRDVAPANTRRVSEPMLGLTNARRRGMISARGRHLVLVDDDNVLDPEYLAHVLRRMTAHPNVGAFGGRSIPRFESPPESWKTEFFPLLALRDLGDAEIISQGLRPNGSPTNSYPSFAPIGAGMALRDRAWKAWLETDRGPSDRCGDALTSGGDNDIVFALMKVGWEVAYFPELRLDHLIPPSRLQESYLCRLNRGIQTSWMRVLTRHHANPWPPLTTAGAALRKARAYFSHRAWSSPAAHIRWHGACGHFDGRTSLPE